MAGNSLVVFGVTVRVNSLTRFEDHSSADLQSFGLANLGVGDFVEVDAYNDGAGLVATRIERDDDQGEVQLEGSAQNVAQPNFTVGGVAVTTDGNTEFRDNNGVTISATTFFQAAPGPRGEGAWIAGGQHRAGHAGRARGLTGVPG